MRTTFVAGNWKMNLDKNLARSLVAGLKAAVGTLEGPGQVGLFPPFTLLQDVAREVKGSGIVVGGQNCHQQASGAYTGEVSAGLLRDAGATHVILGHSERRRDFGETDELVAAKLAAALAAGLRPILCVGEQLEDRDQGRTLEVVGRQLAGALAGFTAEELAGLTRAYEPVWAIGTGRTATQDQAVEVHAALRRQVAGMLGGDFAANLCIQYGGSVTPKNAADLMGAEEIDGALVGGASLELHSFLAICDAARGRAGQTTGHRKSESTS